LGLFSGRKYFFSKKVAKKFGRIKKRPYLCTAKTNNKAAERLQVQK
jgi:hypothetical protein